MKSRLSIIFVLFVIMWAGLIFRGTSLKLFPDQRLIRQKQRQFSRSITVPAKRGAVLDRNGKQLAVSVPSYSLFADPKLINDKKDVAKKLRRVLGGSTRQFRKMIAGDKRRFVWIQRKLDLETRDKIKALNVPGLGFVEEPKRVYPNNTLLAQVLGFIGRDGQGLEGLEYKYNQFLQGEKLEQVVPRDARGRPLVGDARLLLDSDTGMDLTLTVDQDIQYFVENALLDALDEHEAESAMAVVLSVEEAEVIAMATVPGPDANSGNLYSPMMRKNRAISDAFEPGSTMKTFVIAAGLENKLLKPATKIDCEGGRIKVGKHWINEADASHRFDELTVNEILSYSSNVGAAKIGFRIGAPKVHKFLSQLGFGKKTNVGLPGESKGILHSTPWGKHLLSNISFGHGVASTPIQVASAYLAIANGGIYRQPIIVRDISNSMTGDSESLKSQKTKRVMSAEVASTMSLMLTQATSGKGTGASARVPGYPVAGKTGTAQKVDTANGGYQKGKYISSFAGFIPSHKPAYVIYIAVDSPERKYYGSQVAAPVFAKVGSYLMRKTGIPPVLLSKENLIAEQDEGGKSKALKDLKKLVSSEQGAVMPDLQGLSLRDALNSLKGRFSKVNVKGSGFVVMTQPEAGAEVESGSAVQLKLGETTQ